MNSAQSDVMARLTWPVYGVTGSHLEEVLCVNGVRMIIHPSGKLDILAVEDNDSAREAEASIRERFGHLILGHVTPFRRAFRVRKDEGQETWSVFSVAGERLASYFESWDDAQAYVRSLYEDGSSDSKPFACERCGYSHFCFASSFAGGDSDDRTRVCADCGAREGSVTA